MGVYPERGSVRETSYADLVLWDPETIKDMATFENPVQQSRGIEFVLVNGVVAVDRGVPTGARGGRALRRRADGSVTAGAKDVAL
jgi:N-acyl-D-amino-acid deacylase